MLGDCVMLVNEMEITDHRVDNLFEKGKNEIKDPCSRFSNRTYKSLKVSEKTDVYIYNLCSGEGTSVLQLVNTFESVNKIPIPYKIVPRRSGDVATCYANADKEHIRN
ncbi:UDP-glucose 4-epimerase [Streptococcus pneumoniae]|nr:UDP-glucose 4-epimerase [Streptococcus pneumoniae]VML52458.1 UDP-glucose 4-epimerase [Streptococcus pneumoniae]